MLSKSVVTGASGTGTAILHRGANLDVTYAPGPTGATNVKCYLCHTLLSAFVPPMGMASRPFDSALLPLLLTGSPTLAPTWCQPG